MSTPGGATLTPPWRSGKEVRACAIEANSWHLTPKKRPGDIDIS